MSNAKIPRAIENDTRLQQRPSTFNTSIRKSRTRRQPPPRSPPSPPPSTSPAPAPSSPPAPRSSRVGGCPWICVIMMATLLPMPEARHVPHSSSSSSSSRGRSGSNYDDAYAVSSMSRALPVADYIDYEQQSAAARLPMWHVNPFHGLQPQPQQQQQQHHHRQLEQQESSNSASESWEVDDENSSSGSSSSEDIAYAAIEAAMRELRRQRMRHRRHNLRYFTTSSPSATPEWENPCGGVYDPSNDELDVSASTARVLKRKHLMKLRNNTLRELQDMKMNADLDYGNYTHWQREFQFLPNMTRSIGAVKLKTWYRQLQTFAGSFGQLGRAQYKYRKEHQLSLSASTLELHELLLSARRVLCEIETTINASYPNSNGAKLTAVSRAAMNARLQFYTPADGSRDADERDLKFSKELYLQYLDSMWYTLRRSLRKQHKTSMERKRLGAAVKLHEIQSSASSSSSSSVEIGIDSGEASAFT